MKTDASVRWNRTPVAMMAALSLSVVACSGGGADSEPAQQRRAQGLEGKVIDGDSVASSLATEEKGEGHGRSAPAVLVDWVGSPETAPAPLQELTVRIINTTPEKIDTDVGVLMPIPGVAERTRQELGRALLDPEGQVDLRLDLASLPVQTSGAATSLQVVVTYEGSVDSTPPAGPVSEQARPLNSTYSPSLYVTHADDFGSATIRSEEDEARRNGELFGAAGLPVLTGMRINGSSVSEEALTQAPVQRVVALPAGFFPDPPRRAAKEESAP